MEIVNEPIQNGLMNSKDCGTRINNHTLSNGQKDICMMSNNYLVKTARYLAEMFSRYLKDSFFANLNSA